MEITKSPSGQIVNVPNGYKSFIPNALPPQLHWNITMPSVYNSHSTTSLSWRQIALDLGTGAVAGGATGLIVVLYISSAVLAFDSVQQVTHTAISNMPSYFRNDGSNHSELYPSELYPTNNRIVGGIVSGCMVIGAVVAVARSIIVNRRILSVH